MSRRPHVLLGAAVVVCSLLSAAARAHADEPVLAPPQVASPVTPNDPRPAGPAERASVELEIAIDRSGAVTSATVTRSAGDALDEAAIVAARATRFSPATRDGVPIPARIRYEIVFAAYEEEVEEAAAAEAAEAAAAPAVASPGKASIGGLALDVESGEALAGADVVVTTDAGATYHAKTDARGAFRFDGVASGPVHVVISRDGYVPARLDETLEKGTLTEAKLRLERTPDPEAFVATARVDAPPREVTKRTLERDELARVAGTRGDPLRGVELLPGVGRPGPNDTVPILRGANADDSQVFLEGAPVPLLYHLGGLASFVHSRVIDTVELYPSNFSVRYGRKAGGVVEVRLRDPRTDGIHGIADVSLIDSSLLVETPIGDQVAVLAAARRSNIDAVLNSAASTADLAITAAPVYWDYQSVVAWKPTDADRVRLLAYGSSDRLALIIRKPADVDPAIRGAFEEVDVFHRVQLEYRHRWSGGSEQNTELTYGHMITRGSFGQLGQSHFDIDTVQGRTEWVGAISPSARVTAGLDLLANYFDGGYTGIPPTSGEGEPPIALSSERKLSVGASTWITEPGAYLELGVRPIPELLLVPGVRADYNDQIRKGAVDPRLSMRLEATERTALKAGIGRYSQAPQPKEAVEPIGNPNLDMTHAVHAAVGVEHKVTEAVTASVEGFAKWLDGIVTGIPGGRPPVFDNSQDGRIYGAEVLLRVKPTGRFFGFVSYTLMRSERRDGGGDFRLFDRDQTHVLGATAAYRLGRGWEVGASYRLQSGAPYTPVVGSTYEATNDVYLPRAGAPQSERNPAFSRLDLRVEKKWTFSRWSLAAYLDVQNVLNSENAEGFQYSYDYAKREAVRGLPILPSFGLRGEL